MWCCGCPTALLCVLLLCFALAHPDDLPTDEKSGSPFLLGSRYGRSTARVMSPRSDRFFMAGRYGKRSGSAVRRGPADAWSSRRCACRPHRVPLTMNTRFVSSPGYRMPHED